MVLVVPKVVDGTKLRGKYFVALVQMMEIGPGKVTTGITVAVVVHGLGAGLVTCIA